jgi:hypothetical protein
MEREEKKVNNTAIKDSLHRTHHDVEEPALFKAVARHTTGMHKTRQ